jgi:UDP-N-acetylglucosamine 2-epimerase (non-hydrolysing)
MIDTLLHHRQVAKESPILDKLHLRTADSITRYAVLTLHRPSNVDQVEILDGLLSAAYEVARDVPVLFPIHPRTLGRIKEFGLSKFFSADVQSKNGLRALEPLGYLEFLCLMDHATLMMTDSGGIQEETTVLHVPCLTLRENTERPATVEQGTNQVVGIDPVRILDAARSVLQNRPSSRPCPPLWDGKAAQRIIEILAEQNHLSISADYRAELSKSVGKN